MRRTILINLARMLWFLSDRLSGRMTHYANSLFIGAHRA